MVWHEMVRYQTVRRQTVPLKARVANDCDAMIWTNQGGPPGCAARVASAGLAGIQIIPRLLVINHRPPMWSALRR